MGLQVKVLGTGCAKCDHLEELVRKILTEEGIAADIDHVRDPMAIAEWGFIQTPALVVGNRIVSAGRVPESDDIRTWLREAQEQ
jgi:small redox-active disulfide protein 2